MSEAIIDSLIICSGSEQHLHEENLMENWDNTTVCIEISIYKRVMLCGQRRKNIKRSENEEEKSEKGEEIIG